MGTHAEGEMGPVPADRQDQSPASPRPGRASDAAASRRTSKTFRSEKPPRRRKGQRPVDFTERVEELSRFLATSVPATGRLDPELRAALLRLARDIARLLGVEPVG